AFDIVWCKVPQPAFLDRGTARAYLGHRHFALLFPSYDGRLQIGWIIDKGSFGDLRRRGIEGWIAEMARHVSPDLAAHLRAAGGVGAWREPEVAGIQRLQQGPPRLLFGPAWRSDLLLGALLPLLARLGIVTRVAGSVFRRFANGVTAVRLAA